MTDMADLPTNASVIRSINEARPLTEVAPLQAMTLEAFLQRKLPARETLLSPWLPEKGLAMVYAPRGVGKTHFALNVAYAVACGGEFLRWRAVKPRKVLLLDGEMPAVALQERLAVIAANAIGEPPEGFVKVLPYDLIELGGPDLSTEQGQATLAPVIGDAELIVVDNLSTICRAGKENEAESWGQVQAWALAQRRAGRSVLFIHHAGKGGDQRGTSKREDVMDTVVKLSRPEDYQASQGARFNVEFVKSRGFAGSDAEPFEAHLIDGRWAMRALADARQDRIIELASEGLKQREIAAEIGCGLATVNRILKTHRAGG